MQSVSSSLQNRMRPSVSGGLLERVRLYVQLTRPFTLLPPTIGVISGAITAFGSISNPDPEHRFTLSVFWMILLGSVCAGLLNAANNTLNQVYDLEIDRLNKPTRPIPSGKVSEREALILSWILYAAAVLPTWLVVVFPFDTFSMKASAPFFSHQCFLIFVLGMLFTLIYSIPAWGRTKTQGIWANITISIPRGCLLKVAGWSMVAPIWALEPWYIGSIFLFFLIGATNTKDFSDIEGDRAGGCKTLPILYGPKKAAQLSAPFFVLPWLMLPLGAHLPNPWAPSHTILTGNPTILTFLGFILMGWGSYTVYLMLRDPEALAGTENHPSWTHMYLMMLCAQTGFALAYLF